MSPDTAVISDPGCVRVDQPGSLVVVLGAVTTKSAP